MDDKEFYRLVHRAYLRNGDQTYTGEALLLACLLHTKGKGRNSDDFKDVQRLMRDKNVSSN